MASHLVPCPACQRHVRALETACPFCAQVLAENLRSSAPAPLPTTRLSRAALFAFRNSLTGAAVVAVGSIAAAGTVACSSDADNGPTSGQQTSGGTSAGGNNSGNDANGGAAVGSSGANAGGSTSGGNSAGGSTAEGGSGGDSSAGGNEGVGGDNGGAVPPYGGVPVDPPENDGGAGKTDDAGAFDTDSGAVQPLYGAVIVP